MILPVFAVAGLLNILANSMNFNINATRNPDFDIRVRRDAVYETTRLPSAAKNNLETSKGKEYLSNVPTLADIFKLRKNNKIVKREAYQAHNDNHYTHNGLDNGLKVNNNKQNENIFVRTYQSIAKSLGYGTKSDVNRNDDKPQVKIYTDAYNNFYNPYNTNGYNQIVKPIGYTNPPQPNTYNMNQLQNNNNNAHNDYYNYYGANITPRPDNGYKQWNDAPTRINYIGHNNTHYVYNNTYRRYDTSNNTHNGNTQYGYGYSTLVTHNNTQYAPSPVYNNTQSGYVHNNTQLRVNNTQVKSTTERILESCIFCSSVGCPENYKLVGFRCVKILDVDYEY